MVSVVESDVSFYSTLEKAVGCLFDLGMSRELCVEQTDIMFTLVSGKDLLTVLPTSFGKSLIFQMLVRIKQIMMATKYCVRSVGRSVFHGIDRSFTNGLSFGRCRGWQIRTHICLCTGGFVQAISFLANEDNFTVSSEYVCNCRGRVAYHGDLDRKRFVSI